MISNIWNQIRICCGCHGKETVMMMPHDGSEASAQGGKTGSIFYSCPRYYPENRSENERACFNRISIAEYEELVLKISSVLESADASGQVLNLSGMCWTNKRGTKFKVLKHERTLILVSVVNSLNRKQHIEKRAGFDLRSQLFDFDGQLNCHHHSGNTFLPYQVVCIFGNI